jgi:hypothetical protein
MTHRSSESLRSGLHPAAKLSGTGLKPVDWFPNMSVVFWQLGASGVETSKPSTRNYHGYRDVIQRVSHAILRFQFETGPLCDRVLSALIHTETNT